MAIKNFNKIACLLLSLVLVLSLFSVSMFATEGADTAVDTAEPADTATVDTYEPDAAEGTDDVADGTDVVDDGSDDAAPAETGDETAEESGDETTEAENTDGAKEESKKISTGTIVSIAITLVIVVIALVYCIKNRVKVAKFFRECKSEVKKITWPSKNQVAKNTFVVIVVVIAAAIFVALLDLLFSTGIGLIGSL